MCLVIHLGFYCKWDLQFIWGTNGRYSLRHIRWFDFKELLDGMVLLFSDCFGLCPFVLNRIKVWWICWQIFKRMSGLCNCILNILSFVKGRIIHDYNWCWPEFWQQIVYRSAEKNICINIAYEQFHRHKTFADQRTDHINTTSGMPITHTVTPLTNGRISMCSWRIVSKTTFVNIDDDTVWALYALIVSWKACRFSRPLWDAAMFFL